MVEREDSSRGPLLAAAGTIAGILGLIAAYATLFDDSERSSPSEPSADTATVALIDAFSPERGADLLPPGRWIGSASSVVVRGPNQVFLAFTAYSLRKPRELTFRSAAGTADTIRVSTARRAYLAGPFTASGQVRLRLTARPPPARASRQDRRRLSIFLSDVRVTRRDAAALPRNGFWPTETTDQGRPFNWLRTSGELQLVAREPTAPRAWVTFSAYTPRRRTITVRNRGSSFRFTTSVDPGQEPRRVTLGPVPLSNGRSTLLMSASPGASRVKGRLISVQIVDPVASTTPPVRP